MPKFIGYGKKKKTDTTMSVGDLIKPMHKCKKKHKYGIDHKR